MIEISIDKGLNICKEYRVNDKRIKIIKANYKKQIENDIAIYD